MSDAILFMLICIAAFLFWVTSGDMADDFPHNKNKH